MKRKYWIRQTVDYCPVCGSERTIRERIYDEKPKDWMKRYVIEERWDYCDAF
jgi:hypothetical protein